MLTRFMPSSSRCLAGLTIAVTLSGFAGCVSTDEYKKLDAAFQQAKSQLAEAENDLAKMRAQIDSLKAQISQNDSLSGGVGALKAENDLLKQKLADLQGKYDELVKFADSIKMPTRVNDALSKLAEQYPDLLEYDPNLGRIRFKSDLTFDLGSTEVKPRAREALHTLAGILNLQEIAGNQIRIVGHTDDVPIRSTNVGNLNPNNWFLSTNRAHAVREVLQGDGVSDTRIQPAGDGPTQPVAENAAGHKGNSQNRRVEIYILPSTVPANAVSAPDYDSKALVSGARAAAAPRSKPPVKPTAKPAPAAAPTPLEPMVPTPTTLPGVG